MLRRMMEGSGGLLTLTLHQPSGEGEEDPAGGHWQ